MKIDFSPSRYGGFALVLLVLWVIVGLIWTVGEDPIRVAGWVAEGAFASAYDRGIVVQYATLFMLSGLAVALPLRAGLFNIGGEGQILMGGFVAAASGIVFQNPPALGASVLGLAAGMVGGGLWGLISGWLKAYRGGHEVVSSIMLNFIASGISGWLTLSYLRSMDTVSPETAAVSAPWLWQKWEMFDGAPVSSLTALLCFAPIVVWVVFRFMPLGFQWKAVAQSPGAAKFAGLPVQRVQCFAMAFGGSLAGLAGALMVLGDAGRFRVDMSQGHGFVGIPVALLGKGHPLIIVFSAILFAVLHHGSSVLDLEAEVMNHDLAQVIQAVIVLAIACYGGWNQLWVHFFRRER